jgi:hypothetical protein
MNADLRRVVEDRLKSEGLRQRDWANAVLAACDGRDRLERYLRDATVVQEHPGASTSPSHPGAYSQA